MLRMAGFTSMSAALRPQVLRNMPRLRTSDMFWNWRLVSSSAAALAFWRAQAAGDEDVAGLAAHFDGRGGQQGLHRPCPSLARRRASKLAGTFSMSPLASASSGASASLSASVSLTNSSIQRHAGQLLGRVSEHVEEGFVEVGGLSVEGHEDALGGCLHQGPVLLVRFLEPLLGRSRRFSILRLCRAP